MATEVTVGIDIGTTSVKAIAADGDGNVVARAAVPHPFIDPRARSLEHDIDAAWRRGVVDGYAAVSRPTSTCRRERRGDGAVSLGAVHADGTRRGPGLLYGDDRGRRAGARRRRTRPRAGELLAFLALARAPAARTPRGFWPAQATANHALCGRGAHRHDDRVHRVPAVRRRRLGRRAGGRGRRRRPSSCPRSSSGVEPAGDASAATDALLGGGTIDAIAEQLVAGADNDGDVLVICGTTLITWAVMAEWVEKPGALDDPAHGAGQDRSSAARATPAGCS